MNPQIKSLQMDNSTIIAHDANPSTLAEIDIASDGRIAIGSLRGGEPPLCFWKNDGWQEFLELALAIEEIRKHQEEHANG